MLAVGPLSKEGNTGRSVMKIDRYPNLNVEGRSTQEAIAEIVEHFTALQSAFLEVNREVEDLKQKVRHLESTRNPG